VTTTRIRTSEKEARQILLARAIEIVDVQGKLISDAERDELDVRAGEVARNARGKRLDVRSALRTRAKAVLDVVARRNPGIAALAEIPPSRTLLIVGLPLLALVLGFSSDIVANPHRLDLVSLPLLAVVLWNLVFYVLLLARLFVRGEPLESRLRRFTAPLSVRPFSRHTRAEVAGNFIATWQTTAARLNASRLTLALHLSAAAWAIGTALSLFLRGFPYEYRIGWESTWLSAEGVHSLLDVLFWPATTLLKLQPFTLQEITAMRFDATALGSSAGAQRWVFLYAGTLAIVVIIPRLALALLTWLHERALASRVAIDLDEPYFQQLIDRLVPSQVRLAIKTHRDADRAALDRVLQHEGQTGPDGALIATPIGDTLRVAELPPLPVAPAAESWWDRAREWRTGGPSDETQSDAAAEPVVLHVVGEAGDLEQPVPAADEQRPSVLLLVNPAATDAADALIDQCHLHQKHHGSVADVLPFAAFARCWVQEPRLLEAIAACAPPSQAQGARRIASAWDKRNGARFAEAMAIVADTLSSAAREVEEVRSAPLSIRTLLSKESRAARADAKTEAMATVVERLQQTESGMLTRLLELHRVADIAGATSAIERGLEVKVDMRSAVDAPQAGLAGAASGAAMGASVDLVTGGLTLGVAALLGALVGGSAAFLSAAWNNRKSASGATTIQLSDQMLQAMLEASLLRYLAVIHLGRGAPTGDEHRSEWNSEVVAMVAAQRDRLATLWATARAAASAGEVIPDLSRELQSIAKKVLRNLYPDAKIE
jgi:hypothetical protein